MKIHLGTDHAGFELKEKIKEFLAGLGHEIIDHGAFELDANDDYPDFVREATKAVADDPERSRGVVIGGSGQGEAMVANRFNGVRAAVFYGGSEEIIKLSREHNDANVLSLGARFVSGQTALDMVKLWLDTDFSGEERHKRRVAKIDKEG
ncbi:MAG: RpiB/LacA/LacB family sugar-phosphate isomerase [Patescibacteria group bacterium]